MIRIIYLLVFLCMGSFADPPRTLVWNPSGATGNWGNKDDWKDLATGMAPSSAPTSSDTTFFDGNNDKDAIIDSIEYTKSLVIRAGYEGSIRIKKAPGVINLNSLAIGFTGVTASSDLQGGTIVLEDGSSISVHGAHTMRVNGSHVEHDFQGSTLEPMVHLHDTTRVEFHSSSATTLDANVEAGVGTVIYVLPDKPGFSTNYDVTLNGLLHLRSGHSLWAQMGVEARKISIKNFGELLIDPTGNIDVYAQELVMSETSPKMTIKGNYIDGQGVERSHEIYLPEFVYAHAGEVEFEGGIISPITDFELGKDVKLTVTKDTTLDAYLSSPAGTWTSPTPIIEIDPEAYFSVSGDVFLERARVRMTEIYDGSQFPAHSTWFINGYFDLGSEVDFEYYYQGYRSSTVDRAEFIVILSEVLEPFNEAYSGDSTQGAPLLSASHDYGFEWDEFAVQTIFWTLSTIDDPL